MPRKSSSELTASAPCSASSLKPSEQHISETLNRVKCLVEGGHITLEQVLQLFPEKANSILQIPETLDQWRKEIRKLCPNAWDFLVTSSSERKKFQVCGKKLNALASIFGLKKAYPLENVNDFLLFLERVYGQEDQDIQKALQETTQKIQKKESLTLAAKNKEVELIRVEIRKSFPQKNDFLAMKRERRKKINLCGSDLRGIAAVFGVPHLDPIYSSVDFEMLAGKIYG